MSINNAITYLKYFENKQSSKIKKMLHRDCSLRDWEIDVSGRGNVLTAMQSIFDSVKVLSVNIHNAYESKNTAVIEMDIVIDGNKIHVVDIIEFMDEQIVSIRAYKG